jgi:hypothetical protein
MRRMYSIRDNDMASLAQVLGVRDIACRLHAEALMHDDDGYAVALEYLINKIDGVLSVYRELSTHH